MRLVETDAGFVLRPGDPSRDGRPVAKSLLEFLRCNELAFVIGGTWESDILTITPLSEPQRAGVRAWWADQAGC